MKATKLIALTFPVLLLFGCGVGDKDSTPKTEETSKAMLKTAISEKQYPNYICEQMVEFQFVKKDGFIISLGEFVKDESKINELLDSVNKLEETVENIENIKVPSKYKDQQEVMLKGASELRKSIKLVKESKKEKESIGEPIGKLMESLTVVYTNYWEPTMDELSKDDPDAYRKALDKLMKKHAK